MSDQPVTTARHALMLGPPNFVVVNCEELPSVSLEPADFDVVDLPQDEPAASWTWSSGCEWCFVIQADHMLLFNLHGSRIARRCRRKSSEFIKTFVEGRLGSCTLTRGNQAARRAT